MSSWSPYFFIRRKGEVHETHIQRKVQKIPREEVPEWFLELRLVSSSKNCLSRQVRKRCGTRTSRRSPLRSDHDDRVRNRARCPRQTDRRTPYPPTRGVASLPLQGNERTVLRSSAQHFLEKDLPPSLFLFVDISITVF